MNSIKEFFQFTDVQIEALCRLRLTHRVSGRPALHRGIKRPNELFTNPSSALLLPSSLSFSQHLLGELSDQYHWLLPVTSGAFFIPQCFSALYFRCPHFWKGPTEEVKLSNTDLLFGAIFVFSHLSVCVLFLVFYF